MAEPVRQILETATEQHMMSSCFVHLLRDPAYSCSLLLALSIQKDKVRDALGNVTLPLSIWYCQCLKLQS